jgi:hypothetical protein
MDVTPGLIYFTSSRDDAAGNKTHGATGQNFTDIFESRLDKKSKWSTPVPVEGINSEFEDGTPCFSSDFSEIYFTRCEVGKREKKGCVIMYATRTGDKWSKPQDIKILPDFLIAAQPALSADGLTLYFVSEHPWSGRKILLCYQRRDNRHGPLRGTSPDITHPVNELFPL